MEESGSEAGPSSSVPSIRSGAKRKLPPSETSTVKRSVTYDPRIINNLAQQVSHIQTYLQSLVYQDPTVQCDECNDDEDAMSLNTSGDLYQDEEVAPTTQQSLQEAANLAPYQNVPEVVIPTPHQLTIEAATLAPQKETLQVNPSPQEDFSFNVNTTLKEPAMAKTESQRLERLKSVQHFDSSEWSDVRYAEAQKRFCSIPGFTNLECNDEIKPYDKFHTLALTERGFAAITQGLLKQQESVENGFRDLVSWVKTCEVLDVAELENKIKDIFSNDFQKISNDLLQMACGHRAEVIQQRRNAILRSVKDKFIKANIGKIPPSCEFLFAQSEFSSIIDKNGGMSKVFWPTKPQINKTSPQNAIGQLRGYTKLPSQDFHDLKQNPGTSVPQTFTPAQGVPLHPFPYSAPTQTPFYGQHLMPGYNRFPMPGHNFRPRGPRPREDTARQPRTGVPRGGRGKRRF